MLTTTDIQFDKKTQSTFVLNAKGKSEYYIKGTENNKIFMDHPGFMRLVPTSQVCLGEKQGNAKIRYVIGASTIFEDDLYQDKAGNLYPLTQSIKAKKEGWELRPGLKSIFGQTWPQQFKEENRKVVELTPPIGFYNGVLSLDKWGDDPILLEFVKHHECNVNAPNAKFNKHPHSSQFNFKGLEEEKNAEKRLEDTLDYEKETIDFVYSLRTKNGNGYVYTEANKNKIDAVLRVFDLKPGFIDENYAQKLLMVKGFSQQDPKLFMEVINNDFGQVKMNIAKSFALGKDKGIITIEKDSANLTIAGKKRSFLKLESKDYEEQIDEMVAYFLCLRGVNDYKEFIFALNAVENGNLN